MSSSESQLESIRSMLSAGHRSVHLERHTVLLWGGVGGWLCAVTSQVITADHFPVAGDQATALLVWLTFWLGSAAWFDQRLTRRTRALRKETLPFAQAQLTRAWWMLLTMGCLGSFAMLFHGGAGMVYALWTVLLGLGIYLFGLFSKPLTEWVGLATILLGVTALSTGLNYDATRWLAAACFAVGLPLVGWLSGRVDDRKFPVRVLALCFWTFCVTGAALAAASLVPAFSAEPAGPEAPMSDPDLGSGEKVVALTPEISVPLVVDLESALLKPADAGSTSLRLKAPIQVALRDGRPDGRYRIAAGPWRAIQQGALSLRIDRVAPGVENGKPVVRIHARVDTEDLPRAQP